MSVALFQLWGPNKSEGVAVALAGAIPHVATERTRDIMLLLLILLLWLLRLLQLWWLLLLLLLLRLLLRLLLALGRDFSFAGGFVD